MKRIGKFSAKLSNKISIIATASIVGPKEGQGPLSTYFDIVLDDVMAGEESFEKAESKIVKDTLELAIKKAKLFADDIDYVLAGDLLNQNIGSTFGIKEIKRPYLGIYGACSTMGEGLGLGAMLLDGGFGKNILVGVSSHFCAAERQFRTPLELGTQRPPTTTWTVTGDGAVVLSTDGTGPFIESITTGRIVDMGVNDANNMGAAMAPAAADTILNHFKDFGTSPKDYELIVTGDLGYVGHELAKTIIEQAGYKFEGNFTDCGIEIFDRETQDTHCGGSGCACSAVTFAGFYYDKMIKKEINKILLVPTGALLSTTSIQQKETIPCIAHAVVITN